MNLSDLYEKIKLVRSLMPKSELDKTVSLSPITCIYALGVYSLGFREKWADELAHSYDQNFRLKLEETVNKWDNLMATKGVLIYNLPIIATLELYNKRDALKYFEETRKGTLTHNMVVFAHYKLQYESWSTQKVGIHSVRPGIITHISPTGAKVKLPSLNGKFEELRLNHEYACSRARGEGIDPTMSVGSRVFTHGELITRINVPPKIFDNLNTNLQKLWKAEWYF